MSEEADYFKFTTVVAFSNFKQQKIITRTRGVDELPSRQDDSNSTPKSDEDLQKATVGERKSHNAPITLHEYDSRWPELFERESYRIRSVLGKTALQVEHECRYREK